MSKNRRYDIPQNFSGGRRVIQGIFETRMFIEGSVLGGIGAFIGLIIGSFVTSLSVRVAVVAVLGGLCFVIGVAGVGGVPLSEFLVNFRAWQSNRYPMVYDKRARATITSQGEELLSRVSPHEKALAAHKQKKELQSKKRQHYWEEGANFKFSKREKLPELVTDQQEQEPEPMILTLLAEPSDGGDNNEKTY